MCSNIFKCCALFLILFTTSRVKLTASESLDEKLDTYESYVNRSLELEKQDYERIRAWSEEFQVKMVDITANVRLDMIKHQRHYFKPRVANVRTMAIGSLLYHMGLKHSWRSVGVGVFYPFGNTVVMLCYAIWTQCLNHYRNRTTKAEHKYYLKENECLKQASSGDEEKRDAISQVGREIRKWRRSYRYLNNLCYVNNPDNLDKAGVCFIQYMEKDRYINAFQRLISLRIVLVQELQKAMQKTLSELEQCLQTQFSKYLVRVRQTMILLNECYGVNGVQISGF